MQITRDSSCNLRKYKIVNGRFVLFPNMYAVYARIRLLILSFVKLQYSQEIGEAQSSIRRGWGKYLILIPLVQQFQCSNYITFQKFSDESTRKGGPK